MKGITEEGLKRSDMALAMHKAGFKYTEIGLVFSISGGRAAQIVARAKHFEETGKRWSRCVVEPRPPWSQTIWEWQCPMCSAVFMGTSRRGLCERIAEDHQCR